MEPDGNLRTDFPTSEEIVSQGRSILEGQTAHASHSRLSPEDCSVIDRFSLKQLPRRSKILQQRRRTEACVKRIWFQRIWNLMEEGMTEKDVYIWRRT